MGSVRRGRMEREPVSMITTEWVDQHRYLLTPRDIEMLRWLAVFPVLTVEHLWALTPPVHLKGGQRIAPFYEATKGLQICRDRIRRLFDYHFVNKYSPKLPLGEGTSPQYIWLDRAGYRLFELEGRPSKQLSIEYLHHSRIADTYVDVIQLEREGIIKVDYLEACYTKKPKTMNIEPDLILAFRKGNYGYRYFIEVDNGEKKEKEELTKLEKYRDWELGSRWIREEWAEIYTRKFPTVLYLFSGAERKVNRRVKVFSEYAREVDCRGDFLKLKDFRNKVLELRE